MTQDVFVMEKSEASPEFLIANKELRHLFSTASTRSIIGEDDDVNMRLLLPLFSTRSIMMIMVGAAVEKRRRVLRTSRERERVSNVGQKAQTLIIDDEKFGRMTDSLPEINDDFYCIS